MPFPYELYPKAKETHCLNLPEISVSRPPFPGSIRTADGCFWGERDNNSYVSIHQTDQVCAEDNSKCFNQSEVFVDRTVPGVSDTCGQICYAACECNTSNGWYPTCQGTDCYKVVDTRYAGKPNAASASRSLSDVASISASGANSGISASAAAKSGISTMASGATTCYKTKTCSEGGYYASIPADMECTPFTYNDQTCYKDCKKIEYFTIDGKICDADSSQCHSGSITTDQVDNNTMAVFNPTLPYRIKKGETLSNLEAMIPNGIKWEFSHWELQSGSGSFGSTTSALTTFTPNSDVYIIAYVKEAYNCSNAASDLQARINKFNSMIKYAFCDAGCSIPKEHTCNCGSDRERLLKDVDTHNSRCPDNKVGNPGLCPQGGLCKPEKLGACYSCFR